MLFFLSIWPLTTPTFVYTKLDSSKFQLIFKKFLFIAACTVEPTMLPYWKSQVTTPPLMDNQYLFSNISPSPFNPVSCFQQTVGIPMCFPSCRLIPLYVSNRLHAETSHENEKKLVVSYKFTFRCIMFFYCVSQSLVTLLIMSILWDWSIAYTR